MFLGLVVNSRSTIYFKFKKPETRKIHIFKDFDSHLSRHIFFEYLGMEFSILYSFLLGTCFKFIVCKCYLGSKVNRFCDTGCQNFTHDLLSSSFSDRILYFWNKRAKVSAEERFDVSAVLFWFLMEIPRIKNGNPYREKVLN